MTANKDDTDDTVPNVFAQNIEIQNTEASELENVKSFTRTNINKPDFTPRKARKSRHFQHFKPTKQNLRGFS